MDTSVESNWVVVDFQKYGKASNFKTKTFYAIKEIDTTNKYQTHLT